MTQNNVIIMYSALVVQFCTYFQSVYTTTLARNNETVSKFVKSYIRYTACLFLYEM